MSRRDKYRKDDSYRSHQNKSDYNRSSYNHNEINYDRHYRNDYSYDRRDNDRHDKRSVGSKKRRFDASRNDIRDGVNASDKIITVSYNKKVSLYTSHYGKDRSRSRSIDRSNHKSTKYEKRENSQHRGFNPQSKSLIRSKDRFENPNVNRHNEFKINQVVKNNSNVLKDKNSHPDLPAYAICAKSNHRDDCVTPSPPRKKIRLTDTVKTEKCERKSDSIFEVDSHCTRESRSNILVEESAPYPPNFSSDMMSYTNYCCYDYGFTDKKFDNIDDAFKDMEDKMKKANYGCQLRIFDNVKIIQGTNTPSNINQQFNSSSSSLKSVITYFDENDPRVGNRS